MKNAICSKNQTTYKDNLIFDKSTRLIKNISYKKNNIPRQELKNKTLRVSSIGSIFNLSI